MEAILIPNTGAPQQMMFKLDRDFVANTIGTTKFHRLRCRYLDKYAYRISIFYNPEKEEKNGLASQIGKMDIPGQVIVLDGERPLVMEEFKNVVKLSMIDKDDDVLLITPYSLKAKIFKGVKICPNNTTKDVEFKTEDILKNYPDLATRSLLDYRLTVYYNKNNKTKNMIASRLANTDIYGDAIVMDDETDINRQQLRKMLDDGLKPGVDIKTFCDKMKVKYETLEGMD